MKTLRVAAMATLMAIGAISATSTMAATAAELGEPLVYASIAVGGVDGTHESYKRDGSQLSIGYGLGYRFNANYSVELYSRSLEFKIFGPRRDFEYPDSHVGIAAVGRYPLARMFSLTGRVGIGRTKMSRDDGVNPSDKTTVTAGVGAALEFGRHVALTAGYERFSGINTGLWLVGWQLAY